MTEQDIKRLTAEVLKNLSADMSLELALSLTQRVKEKASEMGVKAVIAVSDSAGNPVSVQSMDDAYIASYDIAVNKAYTVVALKMPTTALKGLATPGGDLYGIQFTNNGKIVIFGGGVPLYNKFGELIGGLGVSGGTESQDTTLAEYGKEIFNSLV